VNGGNMARRRFPRSVAAHILGLKNIDRPALMELLHCTYYFAVLN
jgi:hypothetical protein